MGLSTAKTEPGEELGKPGKLSSLSSVEGHALARLICSSHLTQGLDLERVHTLEYSSSLGLTASALKGFHGYHSPLMALPLALWLLFEPRVGKGCIEQPIQV